MTNKDKILQISKELGLSHIGSNLSALPILEEIYNKKNPEDIVILDNAHAHLAHLVVKEDTNSVIGAYGNEEMRKSNRWPQRMIETHGIHCDRLAGCDASGGSLGHGLGISIGYALANPKITIHCIVSDGSMMEGSNWEALRLIDSLGIKNIQIYLNANGYSAVAPVDFYTLKTRMGAFVKDIKFYQTNNGIPEMQGINGHYDKL